jgi:hypothetical protein
MNHPAEPPHDEPRAAPPDEADRPDQGASTDSSTEASTDTGEAAPARGEPADPPDQHPDGYEPL